VVELQKSETKSSPQSAENASGDLESLLLGLQKHLQLDSDNPGRDLQKIREFVEEASAQLDRPQRSLSLGGGDTSKTFKDEPMAEQPTVSTTPDIDQPVRSTVLDKLLVEVVDNPDAWLSTPSIHFGGRRPLDLVGTDEEYKLVDLLQAVDQGLF
jgi:hypothetical protein